MTRIDIDKAGAKLARRLSRVNGKDIESSSMVMLSSARTSLILMFSAKRTHPLYHSNSPILHMTMQASPPMEKLVSVDSPTRQ